MLIGSDGALSVDVFLKIKDRQGVIKHEPLDMVGVSGWDAEGPRVPILQLQMMMNSNKKFCLPRTNLTTMPAMNVL